VAAVPTPLGAIYHNLSPFVLHCHCLPATCLRFKSVHHNALPFPQAHFSVLVTARRELASVLLTHLLCTTILTGVELSE